MNVACPYCSAAAELVTGVEIYPHRDDLAEKKFWRCSPCKAHVGCHAPNIGYGDGTRPLGRLANEELRNAKSLAHLAFDPIWRKGGMPRKAAYQWLAQELGIPASECHIGLFDVDTCKRVTEAVKRFKEDTK